MVIVEADTVASNLDAYLHQVELGETVVIAIHNRPVAELRQTTAVAPIALLPRPFGLCAGEFEIPDDFDAPLPEDILSDFENP